MIRTNAPVSAPLAGGGDLDPWLPSGSDQWDLNKAAHLLRRVGFGGTPQELEAVEALGRALGPDSPVDILLGTDSQPIQDAGGITLPGGEFLSLSDIDSQRAWWMYTAAHSPFLMKEKLVLFWHNHFSVGSKAYNSDWSLLPHTNLFRRFGMGRFRDILVEVTRDSAMLMWLDNYLNGRRTNGVQGINENYARELLELYTMGVNSGYTQTDVTEAAKCLSGWALDNENNIQPRFAYRSDRHIDGPKTVFGRRIDNGTNGQQDAYDLIDTILAQPATAEFMVTKFWEYFVAPSPTRQIVLDLANIWRQSGYDVRVLLRVMFRSNYFYSSRSMRQLIKNPVEFVIGAIRNAGVPHVGSYKTVGQRVANQGLPLLRYKNPAGIKGGLDWLGSREVIDRLNFGDQVTKLLDDDGIRPRFNPYAEIMRRRLTTDAQIVDHYIGLLLDGNGTPALRTMCLQFMNYNDWQSTPFQLNLNMVNEKVRGLVHILMAQPQYQQN